MRFPSLLRAIVLSAALLASPVSRAADVPDPAPHAAERPVVRFGFLKPMDAYGDNNYQPGETDIRKPLTEHLRRSMPDVEFHFVEYELPMLSEAAKAEEIDYALMSSGQYVELRPYGAYALATVYTARFPDPNRFTAALFVTTANHPEIHSIADMKGMRAVFNSKANFINYQLPLAAIAEAGFEPDGFFSRETFTLDRPQEVLRQLLEGRADIGAFRVCEYETLIAKWPVLANAFRPVAVKEDGNQACLRSTDLYPGWTVALTSANASPAMTKRMVETILAMPVDAQSGMGWSVATEFSRVNDVFRLTRLGPYAYLREWTVRRILETFWPLIAVAAAVLIGFIFHLRSVERLAQQRARELNDAYVRQREIEDKAIETEERLAALSRVGVVSQLSSIFAHEMGQPLSAIRYRARAMRALIKAPEVRWDKLEECIALIEEQGGRASRILQKVRSYAKGETSRTAPVRLDLILETTVADMRRSGKIRCPVEMSASPALVNGDELELGLAVLNVLKNAAEAAGDGREARISAKISAADGKVSLNVVNTGRKLGDHELEQHMAPLSSEKKEGMGLGIIIIQSIAEAHGGSFSLTPRPEGGAAAVLTLPQKEEDAGNAQKE